MFINWLLTVFPVEMRQGWQLVRRNLALWLVVAILSALLTALIHSGQHGAVPINPILQVLAHLLVLFLAIAKLDAAARNSPLGAGDFLHLLAARGPLLVFYAVLAGPVTVLPARFVYYVLAALLAGTPMAEQVATGFSMIILISLLARFCFAPFLVTLHRRTDLAGAAPVEGVWSAVKALIWPLATSDEITNGVRWRLAPYLALPYLMEIAVRLAPEIAQLPALVAINLVTVVTYAVQYRYFAACRKGVLATAQ